MAFRCILNLRINRHAVELLFYSLRVIRVRTLNRKESFKVRGQLPSFYGGRSSRINRIAYVCHSKEVSIDLTSPEVKLSMALIVKIQTLHRQVVAGMH